MKRFTAHKHLRTIINRLNACNGEFDTPKCGRLNYHIEKAWVFGSYVKGSNSPNDLDILYDGVAVGEFCGTRFWEFGCESGSDRAIITLRHGMKMIRFHPYDIDGNYKDIPQTKQLIFERTRLK